MKMQTQKAPSSGQAGSWLAQIIPGRASPSLPLFAIAQSMQALTHEYKTVVALEIARTDSGKQFLLRANRPAALAQMAAQMQARNPQAQIRRLRAADDPLILRPFEEVQVVELSPGAAPYHSLRLFGRDGERGREQVGADPLLGILAALDHLPEGTRAVAQLVLSPLPATWGKPFQRFAFEHPLSAERERAQRATMRRQRSGASSVSWGSILALGLLAALLIAWPALRLSRFVPPFLVEAMQELLAGRMPVLTTEQSLSVLGVCLVTAMLLALLTGLIRLLVERLTSKPLSDPKKIAEKISKSAYRARLRLYVINSVASTGTVGTQELSQPLTGGLREMQGQLGRGSTPHSSLPRHTTRLHLLARLTTLWRRLVHWWQQQLATRARRTQYQIWLEHLIAAYRMFHADAYFVPRWLSVRRSRRLLTREQREQQRALFFRQANVSRSKLVLSAEEVATLWHLPGAADMSEITWVQSRQERSLLVPRELTKEAGDPGWPLGLSRHAGQEAEVILPFPELSRHKLVLGRTGKGKSTLFQHFALAQLASGSGGLCVVEPHGDLIYRLLELMPKERESEVTLINLADRMHPPGVNPLDMTQQTDLDRATSTLLSTLKAIWSQSGAWGARQENALRISIKTLLSANQDLIAELGEQGKQQQYTVLDLVPLFEYSGFRRRVLSRVSDLYLRNWWFAFFERLDSAKQDDITTPIITKISAYSASDTARRILGQPCSTIHFPDLIKRGGIVLINTSSGQVGRDVSSLLGATLLGFFSEALSTQLTLPQAERRSFLTLIDEFSNYPVNYEHMLSEMRKAGLTLILAAQSLAQLEKQDEVLRPTIFANAEHLFTFALSGEDAHLCLKELGGNLTVEDVVKQADLSCYVRFSQRGTPLPLFSLHLAPLPAGDPTIAASILQRSSRDGQPTDQVDALLQQLASRHTPFSKGKVESTEGQEEHDDAADDDVGSVPPRSSPPPSASSAGQASGAKSNKKTARSRVGRDAASQKGTPQEKHINGS